MRVRMHICVYMSIGTCVGARYACTSRVCTHAYAYEYVEHVYAYVYVQLQVGYAIKRVSAYSCQYVDGAEMYMTTQFCMEPSVHEH